MKLAEVVAKFIESQGIRHVFGVSGGACLHLMHGIADATQIQFIPTTHECNAGFAADAYARLAGLGCALGTSGPGATNMVTAIATAYYDSVPVLFITGGVTTSRASKPLGVRQYGFQDTPIVEMVRHVTKAAVSLSTPGDLWQLGRLLDIAKEGRPGPVLLEIPDDLQRADVPEDCIRRLTVRSERRIPSLTPVTHLLRQAKRPVFVWGAGMRAYAPQAAVLAERTGIPVVTTWGAIDTLHHLHPLMMGGFGTHGIRSANFVIQNADLVISLGSRLDTKATGHIPHFAREAKIVMVDIDLSEMEKFTKLGREIDVPIQLDVGRFLQALEHEEIPVSDERLAWVRWCQERRQRYASQSGKPYELMREVAKWTTPEDIIVSDTGTALGYLMQGFPFKGERFLHAFNMTPMGYGLPAAIGAALATGRCVVCVVGDGSIMMSISELATVSRWNLPIKIILLDNGGHAMCRQTERQWLGGKYVGTDVASGLGMPHWMRIPDAFGVNHAWDLVHLFEDDEPAMLHRHIDYDAGLTPQAKFGQPIEDADPQLPREEFLSNMIVSPV